MKYVITITRVFLFIFIFSSCIFSVRSHKEHTLTPMELSNKPTKEVRGYKIIYATLHPDIYPLESFYKELLSGKFKKSIDAFSIKYKFSNNQRSGLQVLVDNNIVPVLVQIENTQNKNIDLKRLNIQLLSLGIKYNAIDSDKLPSVFRKLNWPVFGINTYNVVMVTSVYSIVAIIATIAAPEALVRGKNPFAVLLENPKKYIGGRKKRIMNPVTKTTSIVYQDLLFIPETIKPGEKKTGLLFFKVNRAPAWDQTEIIIDNN